MAAAIKRFATRASRLITKRIGNVSQHLVVTPVDPPPWHV